jgi:tryptophan-rich sensory protein
MSDIGHERVLKGPRWLGIVNAFLPVLLIMIVGSTVFSPGSDNATEIRGRPPGWFFAFIWSLITLLWSLALVVSTMCTKSAVLFILFQSMSLVTVLTVFLWLVVNSMDKESGTTAQVLAVCTFLSLTLLVISVTAATENVNTSLIMSLSMAPLFSWCSIATLLNFLAINRVADKSKKEVP